MADGHPSSCAHATIGSVCLCECSGVRHSVAINGGVPAPASAVKGAKGTPTEGKYIPGLTANPTPVQTATPPATPAVTANPTPVVTAVPPEPKIVANPTPVVAATPPEPKPASERPSFDERAEAAASGAAAREAAPVSLNRRHELTETEAEGLDAYIDESYKPINQMLRTGDEDVERFYTTPEQVRGWIDGVDEAMDRSPLAEETQTWRGVKQGEVLFGDNIDGDLTGAEWDEAAYVSTSSDRAVAEGFANEGLDVNRQVGMRIVTPAGVGAVEISGEEYESELLLQRGLRMRVVADRGRDSEGRRLLDVEVLPPSNG